MNKLIPIVVKYYVPTKHESNSCVSRPIFLKAFRFNLKVRVKFPKQLTLSSEELIFRRYGSTEYTQSKFQRIVIRCHLIGGTLLQLSCGTTCFYSVRGLLDATL